MTSDEIHLLWAPPANFTTIKLQKIINTDGEKEIIKLEPDITVIPNKETQADEPINDVIRDDSLIIDTTVKQDGLKDIDYSYNSYKNDKQKYSDEFSDSYILTDDSYRTKRDIRSRRHRKRRQDNVTESKISLERDIDGMETHHAFEHPIRVDKKSLPVVPKKVAQIAYVLYYEEGYPLKKETSNSWKSSEVPTSEEIKKRNVFQSDWGMQDNTNPTKNLTLLNTSGIQQIKVVGFRLRSLSAYFF